MDAAIFEEADGILSAEDVAEAVGECVEWRAPFPKAREENAEVEIGIVGNATAAPGASIRSLRRTKGEDLE